MRSPAKQTAAQIIFFGRMQSEKAAGAVPKGTECKGKLIPGPKLVILLHLGVVDLSLSLAASFYRVVLGPAVLPASCLHRALRRSFAK